jgi:hypothetical protein
LKPRNPLSALAAWLVAGTAFAAESANAQPGAANAGREAEVVKLESFNVSGSQIRGKSTFTAPTPVRPVILGSLESTK